MTTVADMFRDLSDCPAIQQAVILTDYRRLATTNDWSEAFRAALDECADLGKPLYMPAGEYPVKNAIALGNDDRSLHIYGPGATIWVREDFEDYGVFEFRDITPGDGVNFCFRDFAIEGVAKAKLSEQKGVGFAVIGGFPDCFVHGSSWHNIHIKHLEIGFDLSKSFSVMLDRVDVHGCSFGVYAKEHLGPAQIHNCIFRKCGTSGIYLDEVGVSGLSIRSSVFEANAYYGVRVHGSRGVIYIGDCNHFEKNPKHISVEGGFDVTCVGNKFNDCADHHVQLADTSSSYFRQNVYHRDIQNGLLDPLPAIVLNSQTSGFHVFDAAPTLGEGVEPDGQVYAHWDGLHFWESDNEGIYHLIGGARKSDELQ